MAAIDTRSTGTQPSQDEILMFHGLMLAAAARGALERKGLMALETFFNTLPEFAGRDFDMLLSKSRALQARFPAAKASAQVLVELKDNARRLQLFTLALDLALSHGALDEPTEATLETLVQTLEIHEETAAKILSVLMLKYRR